MYGEKPAQTDDEDFAVVDPVQAMNNFNELKDVYSKCRDQSDNEYDFFNLVERSILGMEKEPSDNQQLEQEYQTAGLKKEQM